MVTLDFRKCKTPEDVKKVYEQKKKELQMAQKILEEMKPK